MAVPEFSVLFQNNFVFCDEGADAGEIHDEGVLLIGSEYVYVNVDIRSQMNWGDTTKQAT